MGGTTAALAVTGVPALAATTSPVLAWNQTLLRIVRTPGAHPATVHPTRSFAMMHSAMRNAVSHTPSAWAAASQAAHDVLVGLFPTMTTSFDAQLAAELATVHNPAQGVLAGRWAARQVLHTRANDGSAATPPPLQPGTRPGEYRPTPPAFAPAVFTHWPAVRPFVLARADMFRPDPYPPLASPRYRAALAEVASLGENTSTTRTADQTVQARFWAAPIWNYWNEIAQAVLAHSSVRTAANVFARLNLAFADAVIAFYDAKYHYRIWRPISAIPDWTSFATTPPDPSYPGAHSVISQAAATILRQTVGQRQVLTVTSEALPGTVRHFTTFQQAAEEAGLSRIYGGIHTRLDHTAGQQLGLDVARVALR